MLLLGCSRAAGWQVRWYERNILYQVCFERLRLGALGLLIHSHPLARGSYAQSKESMQSKTINTAATVNFGSSISEWLSE